MAKRTKKEVVLTPEEKLQQALVPVEEQPYPVPENWCWTRFGTLSLEMADGPFGSNLKTEHYTDAPEVRIIQLSNIGEDGWKEDNKKYTTFEHVKTIARSIVKPGNIVIAKMMPAGRAMVCPDNEKMYVLSSDAVKMIPSKNINIKFLVYGINSSFFRNLIQENTQGITRARTSIKKLKLYPFVLPPLPEQQRIVTRIESLFAKLDEVKEKAQAVVDGYEDRKAAILHKAFTGELTAKWREENGTTIDSWQILTVSSIGDVITGSTPSTKNTDYFNGTVPFIKPTELNQGRNVRFSSETLSESGKAVSRPVRAGSTCVCCIGATISKCGLLRIDAVTNQQINSIIPYEFMDDVFVYYYCCSKEFKEALIENSSSTTLPIINKKKMSALQFVVPPKIEQHVIAKALDAIFESELRIKETAESVLNQIDTMKKSILARAFRGELGTNDPSDEPAIELLKRVLQEE